MATEQLVLGDPIIRAKYPGGPEAFDDMFWNGGVDSDLVGLFNYLRSPKSAAHLAVATFLAGGYEVGAAVGSLIGHDDVVSWRQPAAIVLGATAAYVGLRRVGVVTEPYNPLSARYVCS